MTTSGLNHPRLKRMHEVLAAHVDRNDLPGLTALVSRDEDVHVEVLGRQSLESSTPMRQDTIFRIASITKPVTAVAAMILVEECKMRLGDAVEHWLPELANRHVLKSLASEIDDTVPAERSITVRDLMTSCMGFGSVMAAPNTYPIQRSIRELRLGGDGPKLQNQWPRPDEYLRNLGSLPLMAQPGERWMYDVSLNVLGILVARVSGQSLGEFMRQRIFEPLGMKDTAFRVPAEKAARLAGFYFFDRAKNALQPFESVQDSTWLAEPSLESGAGGLASTIDDYFAFSRMLLNQGRYQGGQILSRASVKLMTSDQLTPEQRVGAEIFFGTHSSWGLGFAVDTARREIYHNPGRFGWTGGFGTIAYVDPTERLIGILFTQRMMDSPEPPRVFTDFWTTAYQAVS
jgi:CubicO group peptidase (beta-lactamase class C family)